jgi:hypothetical protein
MKLNNKNKILIFTSILFAVIVYKIAISKTFYYCTSFNSTKERLKNSEDEKKLLDFLCAKNKKLDEILKNNNSPKNSLTYQNHLLKTISNLSELHKVKVIYFEEPEIVNNEREKITRYEFAVEGNFNNVILFLNQLESQPFIGKILHFSTEKKVNYKEKQNKIITTIVLESKANLPR